MILYIHGFGSSGSSGKAELFRDYFNSKNIKFLAPSLPYIPKLAIDTLEDIIKNCNNIKLIGSSLGGFYSIYLANKYNLKAVLINPSINPDITLEKAVPQATNYYDLSRFDWSYEYINMLKRFKVEPKEQKNFMLLLQKGDEVLDYKEALNLLPNSNIILEDGGNHSFEGIERYFDSVNSFLQ